MFIDEENQIIRRKLQVIYKLYLIILYG